MEKTTEYSWYVNISPFNRYMVIDLLKKAGIGAAIILFIQLVPVPATIKTLTYEIGGMLILLYLFGSIMKPFQYFSGISIRYILDEEGASIMEDYNASGLKYVAEQVSTMRWDPMHAGTFRGLDINPRVPRVAWKNVTKVSSNPKNHTITLHTDLGGTYRLHCNDENVDEVLEFTNRKLNEKRYIS